ATGTPLSYTYFDPSAPSNLVVSVDGSRNVSLSWKDNNSAASSYVVQRATQPTGPFTNIQTLDATAAAYVDRQVPNDIGFYQVEEILTSGSKLFSNQAMAVILANDFTGTNPVNPDQNTSDPTLTAIPSVASHGEKTIQIMNVPSDAQQLKVWNRIGAVLKT